MMKEKEKFLGYCLDVHLAGKSHVEWLPIFEQELSQNSYDSRNAIYYLNSIIKLGHLYARLNRWNKFEELINQTEKLVPKISEYKDEAECTYMLLKQRLCREKNQHYLAKELLYKLCKYAIRYDDKPLMCIILNRWGNLFGSLGHTDLSSLFYGYSLEFAYLCREEFGPELYSELTSYPISNLIYATSDDDDRMELFEQAFVDKTFDISSRIFFGDITTVQRKIFKDF